MNDIRIELGVPTQSPFSLDTARSGGYVALNIYSPTLPPSTGQVSLADWYGYCQSCDVYYLSYNDTSALACVNIDPITVISNTIPIGVGSILTYTYGALVPYPYYYSDGSNWYYVDINGSEQTEVMSTGSCAPPVTYTNVGRYRSGTSVGCTSGGSLQFIYLNDTDYATYVSNGNLLSIGMILFSSVGGTAWNTSSYPLVYDSANLVIWDIGTFSEPSEIASINTYC
jgi:hypothetical protein